MANITVLHDAGLELLDGGDVRGALAKLRAAQDVVDTTAAEVVGSVGDAAAGGAAQTLKGMLFGSHLARIYYNQGICHKDLGQQLEAKESYLQALRYQPDFPEAHFNLGRTYQIMADDFAGPGGLYRDAVGRRAALHEAAAHFRNSSEAARPSADSFRSLEEVLAQLGEHDGARLAYGRYIELLPSKALGASLRDSCASALAWLRHREDEAGFMLAELRRQAGAPRGVIVELEHKALAALGFSLAALAPPTTLCTPWNAQAAPGRAFDEPGSGQPPALLRPVAEMAALRAQFERLGHAAVPSALAPSALAFLAAHYRALHRLSESYGGSYKGGGYGGAAGAGEAGVADAILSHNRYAIDNERLARFTADRLLPLLENLTGMRLKYVAVVRAQARRPALSPLRSIVSQASTHPPPALARVRHCSCRTRTPGRLSSRSQSTRKVLICRRIATRRSAPCRCPFLSNPARAVRQASTGRWCSWRPQRKARRRLRTGWLSSGLVSAACSCSAAAISCIGAMCWEQVNTARTCSCISSPRTSRRCIASNWWGGRRGHSLETHWCRQLV